MKFELSCTHWQENQELWAAINAEAGTPNMGAYPYNPATKAKAVVEIFADDEVALALKERHAHVFAELKRLEKERLLEHTHGEEPNSGDARKFRRSYRFGFAHGAHDAVDAIPRSVPYRNLDDHAYRVGKVDGAKVILNEDLDDLTEPRHEVKKAQR